MAAFHYVYILVSARFPDRHYTGLTTNLETRLQAHNAGQVPHTSKLRPWRIDIAIAFGDRSKAIAFEDYLKSHSGRAFAKKAFLKMRGWPCDNRPTIKLCYRCLT